MFLLVCLFVYRGFVGCVWVFVGVGVGVWGGGRRSPVVEEKGFVGGWVGVWGEGYMGVCVCVCGGRGSTGVVWVVGCTRHLMVIGTAASRLTHRPKNVGAGIIASLVPLLQHGAGRNRPLLQGGGGNRPPPTLVFAMARVVVLETTHTHEKHAGRGKKPVGRCFDIKRCVFFFEAAAPHHPEQQDSQTNKYT